MPKLSRSLISLIAMTMAASASAQTALTTDQSVLLEIKYATADAYSGSDTFDEAGLVGHYERYNSSTHLYQAFDLGYQKAFDEGQLYGAYHIGKMWERGHIGVVAGLSSGDIDTKFAGIEYGYTGQRLEVDIRGSHWDLEEDIDHNNNRVDVRIDYDLGYGFGAYYDFTHQFASKDGFKSDEFLAGGTYTFSNGNALEIGMGNIHPKDVMSGESRIWTQYGISYRIGLGKNGNRVDPVDLPSYLDF